MKPVRRLHPSTDLDVRSADTHSEISARRSVVRGDIDLEGIVRKICVLHCGLPGLGISFVQMYPIHDASSMNELKVQLQMKCRVEIIAKVLSGLLHAIGS